MSRDKAKKLLELIVVDKRKRPAYLSNALLDNNTELKIDTGSSIKSIYDKFWLGFIDETAMTYGIGIAH